MRKGLLFMGVFLLMQNYSLAQDSFPRDTVIESFVGYWPIKHGKGIFVLDNKITPRKQLATIGPGDLYTIDILKGDSAKIIYGKSAIYGAVVVITIKYAIKTYKLKLSSISQAYKQYLQNQRNSDAQLYYMFKNGLVMKSGTINTTNKLYELKRTDILSIGLKLHKNFSGIEKDTVNITTKN